MESLLPYALAALGGYLLGSIPFGVIATRLGGLGDIRKVGSGNIGATNVLRTGRKDLALITLVGDGGKGVVAVLLARYVLGPSGHDVAETAACLAGGAAFLGHLFPVWLGFKGGKGVATFIGLVIAFAWPVALGFCAIWLVVAGLTRYSSLSALVASAATPALLWVFGWRSEAALFVPLAVLLWVMHRTNIARLMGGTEGKIGARTG
jgi:acyl phosphate:glycerol-3-phosphate acyltransferase